MSALGGVLSNRDRQARAFQAADLEHDGGAFPAQSAAGPSAVADLAPFGHLTGRTDFARSLSAGLYL